MSIRPTYYEEGRKKILWVELPRIDPKPKLFKSHSLADLYEFVRSGTSKVFLMVPPKNIWLFILRYQAEW